MRIHISICSFFFTIPVVYAIGMPAATSDPPKKPVDAECTVTSPHSENFFDLTKLRRTSDSGSDWIIKGQDYGTNFTMNICAPVLSNTKSAVGLDNKEQSTVGAFYEKDGGLYSIGATSSKPYFRGRKLLLGLENGSPCPHNAPNMYRKTSLISLMCDHEASKPSVAFVGQIHECAYFFEMRTVAACATINQAQALGPAAVFGSIMAVFAFVYCVGGIVYQRTVMHARGWRQIPHYHTWASALSFIWETLLTLWIVLIERLPMLSSFSSRGRRNGFGPRTVGGDPLRWAQSSRSGNPGYERDNMLIDELDDDWEGDGEY